MLHRLPRLCNTRFQPCVCNHAVDVQPVDSGSNCMCPDIDPSQRTKHLHVFGHARCLRDFLPHILRHAALARPEPWIQAKCARCPEVSPEPQASLLWFSDIGYMSSSLSAMLERPDGISSWRKSEECFLSSAKIHHSLKDQIQTHSLHCLEGQKGWCISINPRFIRELLKCSALREIELVHMYTVWMYESRLSGVLLHVCTWKLTVKLWCEGR